MYYKSLPYGIWAQFNIPKRYWLKSPEMGIKWDKMSKAHSNSKMPNGRNRKEVASIPNDTQFGGGTGDWIFTLGIGNKHRKCDTKKRGGGKMGMTGVPSNRLCFMETCHIDIEPHIVKRASGWDEFGKQNTANTYMNSYLIAACIK